MILYQLTLTQEVKLARYQNDSVAIVPIKTFNKINLQLDKYDKMRVDLYRYKKIIKKKNEEITLLKDSLFIINGLYDKMASRNKKTDWQYLKIEGQYERAVKKNKKYRSYLIGGGMLSVGIIVFVSLF